MDARLKGWALALLLAAAPAAGAAGFSHEPWDALLKKHVILIDGGKQSRLRYAGMAQDRALLQRYLDGLGRVSEAQFSAWPAPEQVAFLVNAYNAFMVEKVLARYPGLRSVWDFGKLFGNPFKDEFFSLLGRKASLDWIEHEMLRKRYREPRIHYAVNCASLGCPMLREEAYAAERLERQLEEQEARFLTDRSRNRLAAGRLEVSRIFDWFGGDFEPREAYFASKAGYLADDAAGRDLIAKARAPLHFLEYDWSLNDAGP